MQLKKNKYRIILILFLLNNCVLFSQKKETKTLQGVFLMEEASFVYNTYVVGDDAVVQSSSFLSYSNDLSMLYKNIFELKYNNYLKNAPQIDHENYLFFYDLSSINSSITTIENVPIEDYLINYEGIKFFLVYLNIEVECEVKKKRLVPYYDKEKKRYSSKIEKVTVYKIVDIKDYKVIKPQNISPSFVRICNPCQ